MNKSYLHSVEWEEIRRQRINKDMCRCRLCGSRTNLIVHHRTYERYGHEDLEDLTTLCKYCHDIYHEHINANKKRRKKIKKYVNKDHAYKRYTVTEKTRDDGETIRRFEPAEGTRELYVPNPVIQRCRPGDVPPTMSDEEILAEIDCR